MEASLVLSLALIIMLGGLVGIFLPFIPSIPLIWLGVFFYGLTTDFTKINVQFLLLVSILALATIFLDYIASIWGLKKFEASGFSIFGAVIGGLVGSLFGLIYAVLVGPIVGAVVAEMLRGRDSVFAFRTHSYTIVGFVGGSITKLAVGLTIVALFLYQIFGKGIPGLG